MDVERHFPQICIFANVNLPRKESLQALNQGTRSLGVGPIQSEQCIVYHLKGLEWIPLGLRLPGFSQDFELRFRISETFRG
jgi:hypothetical protein